MARKMNEWPSKRGPITKIMPSDGCIGDTVPWRWESGTISTNLDGIWGMSVNIPARRNGAQSAWAQYTIQTDHRDAVADGLKARGIPTAIYYPLPMHLQPAYVRFGEGAGAHPVGERLCERVLSLPMHPYLDEDTIARVCDGIEATLKEVSVT